MASDTVTLVLDGNPTLDDLTAALDGLRELLRGLGEQVASDKPVTWVVEGLERGSAVGTFLGSGQTPEIVHEVTRRYLDVGNALVEHDQTWLTQSPSLRRGTDKIIGVLNGRVPAVRFETADDDVTISSAPTPAADLPARETSSGAYGAVVGRVQTLTNRGGLRFTLYDRLYDRAVSCYLQDGQQDIMRDVWDKLALVQGWVKRDSRTGRPTSIRQVRAVIPREEGEIGDWRDAAGALAVGLGGEPAEVTIRRLRDAQ